MKIALKAIGLFISGVFEEFYDWSEYLVTCIICLAILVLIWHSDGVTGKIIVAVLAFLIVINAVLKVYQKLLDEKIERQRDEIIANRMKTRVTRFSNSLGRRLYAFKSMLTKQGRAINDG
jgi:hypothetical protein